MAIVTDRQKRLTEVGIIRIGEKRKSSGGKEYPAARETFRLTSRHKALLEAAQQIYGGELRPWSDPKHPGQWELLTEASTIKCIFSTKPVDGGDMESLSQHYEQWAGSTCTHRCNGSICEFWDKVGEDAKKNPVYKVGKRPCACKALDERECKLTSRVSVILSGVPSIGLWRVNTGSKVFDQEVRALVEFIQTLGVSGPVPIEMSLTFREKRTGPGAPTSKFPVIVLQVDTKPIPMAQMLEGYRKAAFGLGDVGVLPPGQAQLSAGAKALPPPVDEDDEPIVIEAISVDPASAAPSNSAPESQPVPAASEMEQINALFEGLLGVGPALDLKAYIEGNGGSVQQFGRKALAAKDLTAEQLRKAADVYVKEVQANAGTQA